MRRLEEIKEILSIHRDEIKERFGVKEIGVFGSYVRGEERKGSDIDIPVEFERTVDFFEFLELEEHLTGLLGIKVDLVMKRALKPEIGENILKLDENLDWNLYRRNKEYNDENKKGDD